MNNAPSTMSLSGTSRHFLSVFDLTRDEILSVFDRAAQLKAAWTSGLREPRHVGRVMALLFAKPSLRTRVSFESAMAHLGGSALYLGPDVGWGGREAPGDFARVLGSYVDLIVCRTYSHGDVEELAAHSRATVINGLTDWNHPCQALTDLFTLQEHFGSLAGRHLAYIGDGNNVARSLAAACARLDVRFTIAAPSRYQVDPAFLEQVGEEEPSAQIEQTDDPLAAVAAADAIYTDVWTSMGQEAEQEARRAAFRDYQVNDDLMRHAPSQAVFLHCLPAHRGEEVTDSVLDGPQSLAFQQAENRMHLQKGLVDWLLDQEIR